MDINTLIMTVVCFLFSWETINNIRYRREDKKLKKNKVKQSDVNTQKEEIELSNLYKDNMLKMMEQFAQKQDNGNANQEKILNKLDTIDTRLENVEIKVDNLETYLNGPYHEWLAKNTKKPRVKKEEEK